MLDVQVTATDGDKDRPQNIVYFLTGQGIDPDNPANSKFDINRTTGEIYVLKVLSSFQLFEPSGPEALEGGSQLKQILIYINLHPIAAGSRPAQRSSAVALHGLRAGRRW
jgi:hypothetical protein